MKKILQISNYYAPHIGGIEKVCQFLSEGIKEEYEVKVICFSEDKSTKIQIINGIEITKVGVNCTIARQSLSVSYYSYLKRIINRWNPDIIHFHYPNPFVTALLLPLIKKDTKLYVHWHLDITRQKKIYPFIKPLETKLLKRADFIVTTSPNYRNASVPLNPFKNKTAILANAIDPTTLDLQEGDISLVNKIKERAKGKKIIFFIGRHVWHKGIQDLIEAEKKINSECYFYIGGVGPLTQTLKASCHSDRFEFVGELTEQEKRCYYHAADIFAFPSLTKAEGFGLTLAEAMYCKAVPVTYTIKGSGVNWVSINGLTGIEVANHDIDAFAKAIDDLLQNDVKRKSYAEAAHQRVMDKFIVSQEVKTLKEQYKDLLK